MLSRKSLLRSRKAEASTSRAMNRKHSKPSIAASAQSGNIDGIVKNRLRTTLKNIEKSGLKRLANFEDAEDEMKRGFRGEMAPSKSLKNQVRNTYHSTFKNTDRFIPP